MSGIGSTHGVPIYVDDCTTSQARITFPRSLVEMDVTVPLLNHVWIEDGEVKLLEAGSIVSGSGL